MRRYLEALVDDANTIPLIIGANLAAVGWAIFAMFVRTSFWLDVAVLGSVVLLAPLWIDLLRRRTATIEKRGVLRRILLSVAHALKL